MPQGVGYSPFPIPQSDRGGGGLGGGMRPQPAPMVSPNALNSPAGSVLEGLGATARTGAGGTAPAGQQPQLPPQAQANMGAVPTPPMAAPGPQGAPGMIPSGPLQGMNPLQLQAMLVLQQLFGGGGLPGAGGGFGPQGRF